MIMESLTYMTYEKEIRVNQNDKVSTTKLEYLLKAMLKLEGIYND